MEENIEKDIIKIWEKSEEEFETMKKNYKKVKEKDRPYKRRKHCEKVCDIVEVITQQIAFDKQLNQELMVAAKLHDIKKYEKKHAKKGEKYVRENFYVENLNVDNICKIIRYHSCPELREDDKLIKCKNITNEIMKAIFIIRIADKLSKKEMMLDKAVDAVYEHSIEGIISKEEKERIKGIIIEYYDDKL